MDALGIMSLARKLSKGVSATQLTDTELLVMLNKSYKDFYKKIIDLDRNYFRDRWTADVVADQYEYSLLQPSGTTFGMFKPEKIRIKYTSTDSFIDVTFRDWENMTDTPERYAVNQSTEEPFAVITDRKYVHIFPTPTELVENGLLFEGAKKPYDLTVDSTEDDIVIDPLYHEALAYMMVPTIEKSKGNINDKNDALLESDRELRSALMSMGLLTTKCIRCNRPDLSSFE